MVTRAFNPSGTIDHVNPNWPFVTISGNRWKIMLFDLTLAWTISMKFSMLLLHVLSGQRVLGIFKVRPSHEQKGNERSKKVYANRMRNLVDIFFN